MFQRNSHKNDPSSTTNKCFAQLYDVIKNFQITMLNNLKKILSDDILTYIYSNSFTDALYVDHILWWTKSQPCSFPTHNSYFVFKWIIFNYFELLTSNFYAFFSVSGSVFFKSKSLINSDFIIWISNFDALIFQPNRLNIPVEPRTIKIIANDTLQCFIPLTWWESRRS